MFETFPILHTLRLDLIEITTDHIDDLFKLYSDEQVTQFINQYPFKDRDEAVKKLEWYQQSYQKKMGVKWGIAFKGESSLMGTIGYHGFMKEDWATVGFDLLPMYWNKGYITETLAEVIRFGVESMKLNRIDASVMLGNTASERVLHKHHFVNQGVTRQWEIWNNSFKDLTIFSLIKEGV
jgi:ribosomal-protein-alanine N-acetyltransferase